MTATFPVVMLTGCRQVGKTTLLRALDPTRRFVSLDDLQLRRFAREHPKAFVHEFAPPVFVDEFQYAPDLLPYIKMAVDEKRTTGLRADGDYWLSGSQNFAMMAHVQESLAGRVGIVQLLGMSRSEADATHVEFANPPYVLAPTDTTFATTRTVAQLFDRIVRGDKPELVVRPEIDRHAFYSSYVQTYLERDVRTQLDVRDPGLFEKFMRLLAGRNGDLLNAAALAGDVGVTQPTIAKWLTVLERSYQIVLLRPYYRGQTKRYVKTPKVYFLDTGLLAWFLNIPDAVAAASHHFSGKLFETWVVTETIKSFWHRGQVAPLFFWRTRDGDEVDLVCESVDGLLPIEIKLSRFPTVDDIAAAKKIKGIAIGPQRIICPTGANARLAAEITQVSAWNLF